MVPTRIAALALTFVLGSVLTAAAQSRGYDPLNPLSVSGVKGAIRPASITPARASVTWQPAAGSYEAYLAEYRRWQIAETQRRQSEGSGFTRFLTGVSNSLAVADQALSVYEHNLDAQALRRYYNGGR